MKKRLISAAFLLGLTSGEVFADSQLKCSGTASTACTAAVTVYNSIMTNAVATSTLAGMVTTVQNTTQPAPQGDPMYVKALAMLSTNPKSGLTNYVDNCKAPPPPPMSQACQSAINAYNSLQRAVSDLQKNLQNNASNLSSLFTDITDLAAIKGNLGVLQTKPETIALVDLIKDFNTFDKAESTAAGIHIPPTEAAKR